MDSPNACELPVPSLNPDAPWPYVALCGHTEPDGLHRRNVPGLGSLALCARHAYACDVIEDGRTLQRVNKELDALDPYEDRTDSYEDDLAAAYLQNAARPQGGLSGGSCRA